MTPSRPRFDLPPRGLTESESAGVLGLGMTEYTRLLPRLETEGFPKRDPLTGRRDFKAIENWMDVRAGLTQDGSDHGQGFDDGLGQRLEEFGNGAAT